MATRRRMPLPPPTNPSPSEFYSYADPKVSILKRLGRRLGSGGSSEKKPREGNIPLPPIPQENSTGLYVDDKTNTEMQRNSNETEQRLTMDSEYLQVHEGTQGSCVEDSCYTNTNTQSTLQQVCTKECPIEEELYVNATPPPMEERPQNCLTTDDVYINSDQVSRHGSDQCCASTDDLYMNTDQTHTHESQQGSMCVSMDDVYINTDQANGHESEQCNLPCAIYESINDKLRKKRFDKIGIDINTPVFPKYLNVTSEPSYYNVNMSMTVDIHSSRSDTQLEEPNVYEAVDY